MDRAILGRGLSSANIEPFRLSSERPSRFRAELRLFYPNRLPFYEQLLRAGVPSLQIGGSSVGVSFMRTGISAGVFAFVVCTLGFFHATTATVSAGLMCVNCPLIVVVDGGVWEESEVNDAIAVAGNASSFAGVPNGSPRITVRRRPGVAESATAAPATNSEVASEFGRLSTLGWSDRAIVLVSGRLARRGDSVFLVTDGSADEPSVDSAISSSEFANWLAAIPAQLWLVLDVEASTGTAEGGADVPFLKSVPDNVVAFVSTRAPGAAGGRQRFMSALRAVLARPNDARHISSYEAVFSAVKAQLGSEAASVSIIGDRAREAFLSIPAVPVIFANASATARKCDGAPSTHALLVGVDHVLRLGRNWDLEGPERDLPLLHGALKGRGVEDIQELRNPTRKQLIAALDALIGRAQCGDDVVVHFSGQAARVAFPTRLPYLGIHETPSAGDPLEYGLVTQYALLTSDAALQDGAVSDGFVNAAELVTAVNAIRNRGAFVLLSVDASSAQSLDVARWNSEGVWHLAPFGDERATIRTLDAGAGGFAAFYAAAEGATSPEMRLPHDDPKAKIYGFSSFAMATALADPAVSTVRSMADEMLRFYKLQMAQDHCSGCRPVFESSDPDHVLFRHSSDDRGLQIELTDPQTTRGLVQIDTPTTRVAGRVVPASGVIGVLVNGSFSTVRDDGRFSTTVPLEDGTNQIQITGLTKDHRIAFHRFTIEHGTPVASQLQPNRRIALIIANKDYEPQSHQKTLETPVRDGEALAAVLRTRFGFATAITVPGKGEVSLVLYNATRRQILSALSDLRRTLSEDDDLLVFYAGHGWHSQDTDQAYWIPVDAEYENFADYISASNITDMVKMMHVRHLLLISDSCYAGALNRDGGADGVGASAADRKAHERYIAEMARRRARILITSGADEPVSDGGGGGHSVFARALLNGLQREHAEAFTAEDLFARYIKEAVAGNSQQSPQRQIIRASGHDGGDFVFWRALTDKQTSQSGTGK
jgi:hypothetical protein